MNELLVIIPIITFLIGFIMGKQIERMKNERDMDKNI